MISQHLFNELVYAWMGVAGVTFIALLFIAAPYGRHTGKMIGPRLPGRVAWLLMEAPSAIIMAVCFATGLHRTELVPWCFLALWEAHYIHRAFIFPLRMRGEPKPMPIAVTLLGAGFNLVNATMNGEQLFRFQTYARSWLMDPRFLGGVALFVVGAAINIHADTVLLNLRRPGESGYKIPYGGLYRLVSCPNYLGEILEWCGFALAAWSLPALTFAVWTIANLLPRAVTNHRWYQSKFADYPPERRALIPHLL